MQSRHKAQIATIFDQAVASLLAGSDLPTPEITLERPRDPTHGDLACTVDMQIAKPLKKNPREIAQAITDAVMCNICRSCFMD